MAHVEGKGKGAHDERVAAAHRAQADALEIEAMAKRRLADEYDAAQQRGEVASVGQPSIVPEGNDKPATAEELGISRKDIHEARQFRDAERNEPGIGIHVAFHVARSSRASLKTFGNQGNWLATRCDMKVAGLALSS